MRSDQPRAAHAAADCSQPFALFAAQVGDASMVLSLQRLATCEDKHLLAGHVLVLLDRDYDMAQQLFLSSSHPRAALDMRMDLKHWAQALEVAQQLDPSAIPTISKQHAAMLELAADYVSAKSGYQQVSACCSALGATAVRLCNIHPLCDPRNLDRNMIEFYVHDSSRDMMQACTYKHHLQ